MMHEWRRVGEDVAVALSLVVICCTVWVVVERQCIVGSNCCLTPLWPVGGV